MGAPVTIASLRTLYARRQTLYEHQLWARSYLELKDLDDAAENELVRMLAVQAAEAWPAKAINSTLNPVVRSVTRKRRVTLPP